MTGWIIVAEKDASACSELTKMLGCAGYRFDCVDTGSKVLEKITQHKYVLAMIDLDLADMSGLELFRILTQVSPETAIIVMTKQATVRSAIEALRLGAVDYFIKPLQLEDVTIKIKQIFKHKRFIEEAQFLHHWLNQACCFHDIIARSKSMQKVCDLIQRVAKTDSNVLIVGKSGTGKELVARAIHRNSHRKKYPFIVVNCGSIPEALFESEYFGYKKGAFTNALKDKPGLFQAANRGTLFFDEISRIPLADQAKLLRAIEFKHITPVGSTESVSVDVRFIVATSEDLKENVEQKRFREDLYYRMNVFEIPVPSLAERRDDIPFLIQHFVRKYSAEMKKEVHGVEPDALKFLMNFHWHGEVRELENVIERAIIFCDDRMISVKDLPPNITNECDDTLVLDYNKPLRDAVKNFERHYILTNLKRRNGNRLHTLKSMGLSESTFYRKLEELGVKGKNRYKY